MSDDQQTPEVGESDHDKTATPQQDEDRMEKPPERQNI